jgi:hypothetical protein
MLESSATRMGIQLMKYLLSAAVALALLAAPARCTS